MSTHCALSIPEILHRIFSGLGQNEPERCESFIEGFSWEGECFREKEIFREASNKAALARAARCCKAFSSPALDVLWRNQTSLLPLLSILPCFEKEGKEYTFVDIIHPSHWCRLKSYARRIRSLHVSGRLSFRIKDLAMVFLVQFLNNQPLLPMLNSLTYPMSTLLFLLISPQLHQVHIVETSGSDGQNLALQSLHEKAPHIGTLIFEDQKIMSSSSYAKLTKFKRLRHLSIGISGDLSTEGLETVLAMPLSAICLNIRSPQCLHSFSPCTRTLQELFVSAPASLVSGILVGLSETSLTSSKIRYVSTNDVASATNWRSQSLVISQWRRSLTFLEIMIDVVSDNGNTTDTSLFDPLLSLGSLEHFEFHSPITSDFSDDDFKRVAQSWPKLEYLVVDNYGGHDQPPAASFQTLVLFATYCPNLMVLELRLDLSGLPPSPHVSNHNLRYLNIEHGLTDGYSFQVARYLDALFPFLEGVAGYGDDDVEDDGSRWKLVNNVIQVCQETRRDREKWFSGHDASFDIVS